jgi:hypothetical protein
MAGTFGRDIGSPVSGVLTAHSIALAMAAIGAVPKLMTLLHILPIANLLPQRSARHSTGAAPLSRS